MKVSLKTKTALVIVIVSALIASVSIIISYKTYSNTIDNYYKNTITNIANTAASMMDADKIDQYCETLTPDEEYDQYLDKLFKIKKNNDIKYLYIEKIVGQKAIAVMDADTSDEAMKLGDTFDISSGADVSSLQNGIPAFISNEGGVGWVCSVFVPITDSDENVVALVGADISMDEVMAERHQFLSVVCIAIIISTLISVVALILLIQQFIVKPINQLSKASSNFICQSENNKMKISENSPISMLTIKTGDEIESLSDSIKLMEKEIYQYIDNLTTVTAERERIGAELNIATQIQADMLPRIFPAFPERTEFDIYALMSPAKEVGGDFYDFFLVDDNHIAVVIADVSGKGVPAALFMVIAKTLIKNHAQSGCSPAEVFTKVNEQLCEGNEAGLFVTAWIGVIDINTGKLEFANAGHNPPFLKKSDGRFEMLKSRPGFVLAGIEGIKYKQNELFLSKDDTLYLYTDGVTEATDSSNQLYGEERLNKVLDRNAANDPQLIITEVRKDVDAFVKEAPQFDDITMLAFCYHGCDGEDESQEFPAEIEQNENVTAFVDGILEKNSCPDADISKANIIVDEIFSNIVKYSGSKTARISCGVQDNNIILKFEDSGTPYNPLEQKSADITASADERPIGGLGILMVRNIADKTEYEFVNNKNVFTVIKSFDIK